MVQCCTPPVFSWKILKCHVFGQPATNGLRVVGSQLAVHLRVPYRFVCSPVLEPSAAVQVFTFYGFMGLDSLRITFNEIMLRHCIPWIVWYPTWWRQCARWSDLRRWTGLYNCCCTIPRRSR
jgi:hypothetical protein